MHNHDHQGHGPGGPQRSLLLALLLTLSFALIEAIAGWWSGSLALISDAGHMVTDSLALGLAAAAAVLARRRPSARYSYGWGRAEILSALFNALVMIALIAVIGVEALHRLRNPGSVEGIAVISVAFVGLLINLAAAWLLSGEHGNLNVRAALLHVLGDLLGSVAALASGAVIMLTGWVTIDPLLSLLIALLILVSAVRILHDALHALLEGVPRHLDLEQVGYAMAAADGVVSVHDLHIWSLSASRVALSAHVVVADLAKWPEILMGVRQSLAQDYRIEHVTLQPELQDRQAIVVPVRPVGTRTVRDLRDE